MSAPAVQVCANPALGNPISLGPNAAGREMQMVIIGRGVRYGLNLCLVNKGEPMVEFNDCSSWVDVFGRGQFTGGRYFVDTIRKHHGGLTLDGGNAEVWHLTNNQMAQAVAIINKHYPLEA